jgi:hypothetical protein
MTSRKNALCFNKNVFGKRAASWSCSSFCMAHISTTEVAHSCARWQICEKATISFVMLSVWPSIRPSVRFEQLGSHPTDFPEIFYLIILRKYAEKGQASLKSDKNNGHST